jgi:hypothetical protein
VAVRAAFAVASDAGLGWDFVNFYNAGARAWHGQLGELYRTTAPIAGRPPLGPARFEYTGFPLTALLFAPLGALPPRAALLLFKVLCAAAFAGGLVRLFGWLAARDPFWRTPRGVAAGLAAALVFEPLWLVFAVGGQSTAFAFLALAAFATAARGPASAPAGVWLALAALLKPALGVGALALLAARAWPALVAFGATLGALAAASLALVGVETHLEWLGMLRKEGVRWAVPPVNNASLMGLFGNFWLYLGGVRPGLAPPPPALLALQLAAKAALLAAGAWLAGGAARPGVPAATHHALLVGVAVLLPLAFSSVVWPHYLAFVAVPLAAWAPLARRRGALAWAALALVLLSTLRANLGLAVALERRWNVNHVGEVLVADLLASGTLVLAAALLVWMRSRAPAPARRAA